MNGKRLPRSVFTPLRFQASLSRLKCPDQIVRNTLPMHITDVKILISSSEDTRARMGNPEVPIPCRTRKRHFIHNVNEDRCGSKRRHAGLTSSIHLDQKFHE